MSPAGAYSTLSLSWRRVGTTLSRVLQSSLPSPLHSPAANPRAQFDVAVVIQTVVRSSLDRALQSIFTQRSAGRIQVLVGNDERLGDGGILKRLLQPMPAERGDDAVPPGSSTS